MNEEEKKEVNDLQEDERENEEETKDVENEEVKNDLEEDNREENEELANIKQTLAEVQKRNEELILENEALKQRLEDMNNSFLNGEVETEESKNSKKDYEKLIKGII